MRPRSVVIRPLGMLVVLIVGLFVYASTRTVYRLRVEMPAEFLDAPASLPPAKRAAEEKVARAYWYTVVTTIQPNYGYRQSLPQNPPPEFKIGGSEEGARSPETQLRYWHRLQQLWYSQSIWTRTGAFDLEWLDQIMSGFTRWVHNIMTRFVGNP